MSGAALAQVIRAEVMPRPAPDSPGPLGGSPGTHGFTLVEMLVSLLIFGLLAAAGVALLTFSARSQEAVAGRLDEGDELRRFSALLSADLRQSTMRDWRDRNGVSRAAFRGYRNEPNGILLAFVRSGWDNYDGAARSSLQKVYYRLAGSRIERIGFTFVDGAAPLQAQRLLDGVEAVELRFRDLDGQWREDWNPAPPASLPAAVEVTMVVRDQAPLRQLFLVGPAR